MPTVSMLRRAMHYLGLAPDDEYVDDYVDDPAAAAGRGAYVPPEPPEQPLAPAVRPARRWMSHVPSATSTIATTPSAAPGPRPTADCI